MGLKHIVIAFTLKGQEFASIAPVLEKIAALNPDAELIHGFMSRADIEAKGFSTEVIDKLDELFAGRQISFYEDNVGPNREAMKNYAYQNSATAYVIGNVKEGVKEEIISYIKANIKVVTMELAQEQREAKSQIADEKNSAQDAEQTFTKEELLEFANYVVENSDTIEIEDVEHWLKTRQLGENSEKEIDNDVLGLGGDASVGKENAEQKNYVVVEKAKEEIPHPGTNEAGFATEPNVHTDTSGKVDNQQKAEESLASKPEAVADKTKEKANAAAEAKKTEKPKEDKKEAAKK